MTLTKYAKDHKNIKDMIERMRKETGGSTCIIMSELSKELEMDSRTVKKHLEVMEIDGYGKFSDSEKKHLYCFEKDRRKGLIGRD